LLWSLGVGDVEKVKGVPKTSIQWPEAQSTLLKSVVAALSIIFMCAGIAVLIPGWHPLVEYMLYAPVALAIGSIGVALWKMRRAGFSIALLLLLAAAYELVRFTLWAHGIAKALYILGIGAAVFGAVVLFRGRAEFRLPKPHEPISLPKRAAVIVGWFFLGNALWISYILVYSELKTQWAEGVAHEICDAAVVGGPIASAIERAKEIRVQYSIVPGTDEHPTMFVVDEGFFLSRYFCSIDLDERQRVISTKVDAARVLSTKVDPADVPARDDGK
jgi:hypothetical protein